MPSIAKNIIAVTSSASSVCSTPDDTDNDSSFEIISDFESEFESEGDSEDFEASECSVASDHSKSKSSLLNDCETQSSEASQASAPSEPAPHHLKPEPRPEVDLSILKEIIGSWKVISIVNFGPDTNCPYTIGDAITITAQPGGAEIVHYPKDGVADRIVEFIAKQDDVCGRCKIIDYIENNRWVTVDWKRSSKTVKWMEFGKLLVEYEAPGRSRKCKVVYARTFLSYADQLVMQLIFCLFLTIIFPMILALAAGELYEAYKKNNNFS